MPKKILVVDDDVNVRDFMSAGLQEAGYEVHAASDGQQGWQLAQSLRPDLMILDIHMPLMHGYEVCQKVRADKSLAATKVIITSAKNYLVDIRTAHGVGADVYLNKPCSLQEILNAVGSLLPA